MSSATVVTKITGIGKVNIFSFLGFSFYHFDINTTLVMVTSFLVT